MCTCDVVIDITQGDSFSDIYGEERFFRLSNIKYVAEILQIPFILGPQTYGPFMKQKVEKFARKIINKANLVVSRDVKSAMYLKELCDKDIYVGKYNFIIFAVFIEQCYFIFFCL